MLGLGNQFSIPKISVPKIIIYGHFQKFDF